MADQPKVILELFVQGQAAYSNTALDLVRRVCEAELGYPYTLEVIDVLRYPERAVEAGVLATPTLVRRQPEPELRTTGRFSVERVRQGLGLHEI